MRPSGDDDATIPRRRRGGAEARQRRYHCHSLTLRRPHRASARILRARGVAPHRAPRRRERRSTCARRPRSVAARAKIADAHLQYSLYASNDLGAGTVFLALSRASLQSRSTPGTPRRDHVPRARSSARVCSRIASSAAACSGLFSSALCAATSTRERSVRAASAPSVRERNAHAENASHANAPRRRRTASNARSRSRSASRASSAARSPYASGPRDVPDSPRRVMSPSRAVECRAKRLHSALRAPQSPRAGARGRDARREKSLKFFSTASARLRARSSVARRDEARRRDSSRGASTARAARPTRDLDAVSRRARRARARVNGRDARSDNGVVHRDARAV